MPASCASAGVGYWQPTHFRSLVSTRARFARWIAYAPRRPIARLTSSSSGRASAPPLTSTCHPGCTSMQVSTSNLAYCSIRGSVKLRSPDGRVERSLQTAARPKPGRPESAVASAGSSANGCGCGGEEGGGGLRDWDGGVGGGGGGGGRGPDR